MTRRALAPLLFLASCTGSTPGGDVPDGGAAVPDGGAAVPDSSLAVPDSSRSVPDSAPGVPDSGPVVPDGAPPRTYPWTWETSPPPVADCSPTDWVSKAMTYRDRFRTGFIGIGDGPGMSMPATLRDPTSDCATDWQEASCTNQPIPGANGAMRWGDGTIWMGWYLRELGAEWVALHQLGMDTTQTESDISYALDALDRLDLTAETYFGVTPALDGFFIRDDVSQNLMWADDAHTILRFPRTDGPTGYACVSSDSDCGAVTTAGGSFISEDQFIEMLPGLAMIAKLVPQMITVGGQSLSYRAQEFTHRVTMYLKNNDWKIVDPTGASPPNQWGGTAAPYSTQIAAAANFITGNTFGVADYSTPQDAGEAAALAEGATVWAAVDTSWALQTNNNQSMILSLASVTDAFGDDTLAVRGADWDAPVFVMISAALHGRPFPAGVARSAVESMLTSAPCTGPCFNTPNCASVPGWMGEHRFKSPEDRNGDTYGVPGEFGGLDYLLLWGLYVYLEQGDTQLVWDPPPRCFGTSSLDQLLAGGATAVATYDPWNTCESRDFGRTFCGRPWAGWLDAAYHGQARIFFAGGELVCDQPLQPCHTRSGPGVGGAGTDLFLGGPGDDTFDGGDGDDCIYGFDGNDTLHGGLGGDEIHGGPGNDTICGEECDLAETNGGTDDLYGDEDDDTISGGPDSDMIHGGPGNDTISGNLGWDRLSGDDGNDTLDGNMGDDVVNGDAGDDTLYGSEGDDFLNGGDGRDKLDGGDGNDTLSGGPGDDFLMGGAGDDTLWGQEGSDRLCGGCGSDNLYGGWDSGVDSCRGEAALICWTSSSNNVNECETSASASDCLDSAFNSW